jgi:ABC-type enterochelin transport system substrate-binding protein
MTNNTMAVEVNCETGEVIERQLTETEIADQLRVATIFAEQKAAEEADAQIKAELKASAKAKLIAGQPLTAEEADLLVI